MTLVHLECVQITGLEYYYYYCSEAKQNEYPLMRNEEIPNSQSQTTYFDLLKLEFNVDINVT